MQGTTARVYLLLPCEVCGRNYGGTADELAAMRCCGRELPVRPAMQLLSIGAAEDAADTPHVVTGGPTP